MVVGILYNLFHPLRVKFEGHVFVYYWLNQET